MAGARLSQGAVQIAPPHDVRRSDDSTKADDDRRSDASAKSAFISVSVRQTSRGVGGEAAPPPHEVRRSDDSAQGALISVNIPKMMIEEVMFQQ